MEMFYYTAAGIFLYLIADAILNRIEYARGARLPYRSMVFFAIILILTLILFSSVRMLTVNGIETPLAQHQNQSKPIARESNPTSAPQ